MKRVELDEQQAEMLGEVLESYLSDLSMEIADTDSKDYRDRLKARQTFLKWVIERLA